jgi:transposase
MVVHKQLLSPPYNKHENGREPSAATSDLWDYTPDFLGLPFWRTIAYKKSEHDYEIMAEPLTLPECPDCGPKTLLTPTGTLVQKLRDIPRDNCRAEIHFIRRRFGCSCGRNLTQPLPSVVEGRSITVRGAVYVAFECLSRSFEEVAEKVGCSSTQAKELFADLICILEAQRNLEAPKVLGIDGVCVGRRIYKRSYCQLTDIANSRVFELLSKSTKLELARFLEQLPDKESIKVVVIDMSMGFLSVTKKILPWVIVVIDPFHVVRMLNDAVTKCVRTKQQGITQAEHKRLMKGGNRFLLLKRRFELTEKQKNQLKQWFKGLPEFKEAFDLKEVGYDIYKATTRESAERHFEEFEKSIPKHLKPAFQSFLDTVKRWKPYIFNYFDHKVSNALTESKNRNIKTLQRLGPRTSFTVLRARVIFADVARKPPQPKSEIKVQRIRKAMKQADELKRTPETWDPNSYVARINNARKEKNEFSRLLRPVRGWEERFEHFSYYSKEKSPYKWDFIWPASRRPKKIKG